MPLFVKKEEKGCHFRSYKGTKFCEITYFLAKYVWSFKIPEFCFTDILQTFISAFRLLRAACKISEP